MGNSIVLPTMASLGPLGYPPTGRELMHACWLRILLDNSVATPGRVCFVADHGDTLDSSNPMPS